MIVKVILRSRSFQKRAVDLQPECILVTITTVLLKARKKINYETLKCKIVITSVAPKIPSLVVLVMHDLDGSSDQSDPFSK